MTRPDGLLFYGIAALWVLKTDIREINAQTGPGPILKLKQLFIRTIGSNLFLLLIFTPYWPLALELLRPVFPKYLLCQVRKPVQLCSGLDLSEFIF